MRVAMTAVLVMNAAGLLAALGFALARKRDRAFLAAPPGLPWVPTRERFVDPARRRLIGVWELPATGERAYVDLGEPGAPFA